VTAVRLARRVTASTSGAGVSGYRAAALFAVRAAIFSACHRGAMTLGMGTSAGWNGFRHELLLLSGLVQLASTHGCVPLRISVASDSRFKSGSVGRMMALHRRSALSCGGAAQVHGSAPICATFRCGRSRDCGCDPVANPRTMIVEVGRKRSAKVPAGFRRALRPRWPQCMPREPAGRVARPAPSPSICRSMRCPPTNSAALPTPRA
jgi:hypothetical protein